MSGRGRDCVIYTALKFNCGFELLYLAVICLVESHPFNTPHTPHTKHTPNPPNPPSQNAIPIPHHPIGNRAPSHPPRRSIHDRRLRSHHRKGREDVLTRESGGGNEGDGGEGVERGGGLLEG